jgi:hypothetical protein
MNYRGFIFAFVLFSNCCFSQQVMRVSTTNFGYHTIFEAYPGEVLDYKLKGERKFRQNKIYALNDSIIFFDNDLAVKFSQLKRIRFKKNKRLIKTFSAFFIRAGLLFIILDSGNNLLLGRQKIVNEKAVLISASLIAGGLILKRMGIKKIRMNKNKIIKVIDVNYQHLGK